MQRILSIIAAATLLSGGAAFAQSGDAPARIELEIESPRPIVADDRAALTADELVLELAKNEAANVTFLGVTTGEVPEVLRHHLKLSGDAGLIVEHVVPDSPADKAGLKRHDVIEKLSDQLLVNGEQLATLVRSKKAGDEIELTVHRDGKPITVAATLEERQTPQSWLTLQGAAGPHIERLQGMVEELRAKLRDSEARVDAEMREQVDRIREELKRMREEGPGLRMRVFPGSRGPQPGWHPEAPTPPGEAPRPPDAPRAPGFQGFPGAGAGAGAGGRLDAQSITIRSSDPQHVVELQIENGEKTLKVTEADGDAVVFEGPVDTPEQREQVPAELRSKLARLEQALDRARPGPGPGPGRPPGIRGPFPGPGPRGEDDDRRPRPFRPDGRENPDTRGDPRR